MQSKDFAKTERVMKAMLQMTKLDIQALKRAYEQKTPPKAKDENENKERPYLESNKT